MTHHMSPPDPGLFRWGAVCGIVGVVTALVQVAINPSYADDPAMAIQQASLSHFLTFSRLLDMMAFLLLLCGVTVITSAFRGGRGAAWAGVAQTLYTVSAAAGAIATMIVGSLPDVADSWAKASPAMKPGYVAVYDALDNASGAVFSVSWAALGGFGMVRAIALRLSPSSPPSWPGSPRLAASHSSEPSSSASASTPQLPSCWWSSAYCCPTSSWWPWA